MPSYVRRHQQPASGQAFAYAPTPKNATEGARAHTATAQSRRPPNAAATQQERAEEADEMAGKPPPTEEAAEPRQSGTIHGRGHAHQRPQARPAAATDPTGRRDEAAQI
jgi:hypothetical protein